ncbi:MAG: PLP-dependent aminotransferase family protein [Aquabacterium sp.]|uniref:aminotransferase-like domain-containing protein n=1 Tax=Aquabacterium sp. TaxID=1872578 RepID=UPI001DB0C100|nr:PLP-dependent aminotransferase family protein [Aquabacterium sp.]MBT9610139.1 PLP-dependent aminotransferase family protein [Aquabacterium sp.]
MHAHADTLYLKIADAMARQIRTGTLPRGERIPSVRNLASQHGVSQSTVVQAYRTLEDARLIEARPRSGYFVAARPPQLPEPDTSRPPRRSVSVGISAMAAKMASLAHHPDYVSFGAACPEASLFAQERVRRAVSRATQRHRGTLCQYPFGPGDESLRRAIARHVLRMGCHIDTDDIVVTSSCLESISLCLRTVTKPGDVVALESPTYYGFLDILENLGLRALEIPTHPRTGLSLDALQLALDTHPIKALLAVPTLSNPIGASMPVPERKRLVQMLARHKVPMIEDVLYNDLCEDDDRRRAVQSFDTAGQVMLCGSFSKTIAPGLRLGWIAAPAWTERLQRLKAATSGSETVMLQRALADLLTQPGIEAGYRQLRGVVAARVDEARGLISRHFPKGTRVTAPAGGFILWLELPGDIDTIALFEACLDEHICIAPGSLFSATDRFRHCMRLGLGGKWGDAERRALARVGKLAEALKA